MVPISVIVPSYRSSATLARTVDSLFRQTKQELLKEVIVVDSSDDEPTRRVLDGTRRAGLRVVRLTERAIPAVARNRGVREASGKVLAFIDSDAYADTRWLEEIAAAYERGSRAGGGAILLPPEQLDRPLALAQYYLQFSEFMEARASRVSRFTPSCNLFCERELFLRAGGFPEIRAAEDVLFGDRITSLGEAFHFEPSARVYHIFADTWKRCRTNQTLLGEYTLTARRNESRSWAWQGAAPFFLAPVFAVGKACKVVRRVLTAEDPLMRGAFAGQIPHFLYGLFFLSWGFGAASLKKKPTP